jgi:hypothetical protein
MHPLRKDSTHLTCISAYTYVEAERIRPFSRMSSGVVRGRRGVMLARQDWKLGDTRLAATSHFSEISPVSPAVVSPPGPQLCH